jgi:outer membrane lipoprotein
MFSFLAILLLGLVSACAPLTPPTFPQNLVKEVNPSLSFQEVQRNADAYRGTTMLLGGDIVEARLLPDGQFEIKVREKKLDAQDVPIIEPESKGMFLVLTSRPENPDEFRPRRRISLIGEVLGVRHLKVAGIDYPFILLKAKAYRLWPAPEEIRARPIIYFPWEVTPRAVR